MRVKVKVKRKSRRQLGRALYGVLAGVSKRDFVAVAGLLCEHGASPGLVGGLGRYFKSQNPAFDTGRFERAALCEGSASRRHGLRGLKRRAKRGRR